MKRLIASLLALPAALGLATPAHAQDGANTCPPYETVGEGPDLLLVPGLGSSPDVWNGVRESLESDYRLHLVHIAGFGGRDATGDPETIVERSLAEITEYLDCKGIESAAYAGHSMGGFLGLKLAAAHPARIERLIVVDALPFYPLIFNPAATPELVAPQAAAFRAQIMAQDDAAFENAQAMGVRSLVKDTEYHNTVVGWSIASDRATFAGAIHALMTKDARAELPAIKTPPTIIAASNAFAPIARVEALYGNAYKGLEGAELRIVEDSYHFIMFDQPEAFEAELRRALSHESN